jgi:hypothetical protein
MSASVKHVGVDTFRIPRSIVRNSSLKTLSGNSLALFISISYRCYRARLPAIDLSFRELFNELHMGAQEVQHAAHELRDAKLIHFQQDKNIMFFQIQQPDGSKAKSYLRTPLEPVEPVPTQD